MKITVYDTETNGLDTKNGFIQELAWATYDVSFLSEWRLISCESHLLRWPEKYDVDQKALEITGIDRNFCFKNGSDPFETFEKFLYDCLYSEFLAGQNAILFDRDIVYNNIKKASVLHEDLFNKKAHIDSYFDIRGPIKPKSLKYFALDHGYVLNNAHSAIHDVFACAHILSKYPIEDLVYSAIHPLVKTSVQCDYGNKKLKDRLYEEGFRWNPEEKNYTKTARRHILDKIIKTLELNQSAVRQEVLFDGSNPQEPSPHGSGSHDNTPTHDKSDDQKSDQLLFPES